MCAYDHGCPSILICILSRFPNPITQAIPFMQLKNIQSNIERTISEHILVRETQDVAGINFHVEKASPGDRGTRFVLFIALVEKGL